MLNSLYKTLAKPPAIGLYALSFSSNYRTIKFSSEQAVQDAAVTKEKNETEVSRSNSLRRPSEICFQSKVANLVNLIGKIQTPVRFVTSSDGKSWAGTIISQGRSSDLPLRMPIIFEDDLAHTAAFHLKVRDTVHITGHLSSDPLPINLTNNQVDFQVKVHDVHFIRRGTDMKKTI